MKSRRINRSATEVQGTRHFGGIKQDGIQFCPARPSVSASSVTPAAHLQVLSLKEAVGSASSTAALLCFLSYSGRVGEAKSAKLPLIEPEIVCQCSASRLHPSRLWSEKDASRVRSFPLQKPKEKNTFSPECFFTAWYLFYLTLIPPQLQNVRSPWKIQAASHTNIRWHLFPHALLTSLKKVECECFCQAVGWTTYRERKWQLRVIIQLQRLRGCIGVRSVDVTYCDTGRRKQGHSGRQQAGGRAVWTRWLKHVIQQIR